MRYYKYVNIPDRVLAFKIHQAVWNCEGLAKAKYKANWEDALDEAYFHILEHYDESQGELEHYAVKVVNTIYLNKFSKEVSSDLVYSIESNKLAVKEDKLSTPYDEILNKEDIEYDAELRSCIQYLLPYFIKDFKFFDSKDGSNRRLDYSGLFDKFSYNSIDGAIKLLMETHSDDARYIKELSKSCKMRDLGEDRYKNSMDKTLQFSSRIGDIVTCKTLGIRRKRYAYVLDIRSLVDKLFIMFYSDDGIAVRTFFGSDVYCSFSGGIFFNKEDLYSALEREVIGTVLAIKSNLKVLKYNKGKDIILSSTNVNETNLILSIFKAGVCIPLRRLTIRIVR